MLEWKTCPDCGRQLPAAEMKKHRPGGMCLKKINRAVKGSPCTKVISGGELHDRATYPPSDPEVMHRKHRAHIARLQNESERIK